MYPHYETAAASRPPRPPLVEVEDSGPDWVRLRRLDESEAHRDELRKRLEERERKFKRELKELERSAGRS
jgi:hypothetical protein